MRFVEMIQTAAVTVQGVADLHTLVKDYGGSGLGNLLQPVRDDIMAGASEWIIALKEMEASIGCGSLELGGGRVPCRVAVRLVDDLLRNGMPAATVRLLLPPSIMGSTERAVQAGALLRQASLGSALHDLQWAFNDVPSDEARSLAEHLCNKGAADAAMCTHFAMAAQEREQSFFLQVPTEALHTLHSLAHDHNKAAAALAHDVSPAYVVPEVLQGHGVRRQQLVANGVPLLPDVLQNTYVRELSQLMQQCGLAVCTTRKGRLPGLSFLRLLTERPEARPLLLRLRNNLELRLIMQEVRQLGEAPSVEAAPDAGDTSQVRLVCGV